MKSVRYLYPGKLLLTSALVLLNGCSTLGFSSKTSLSAENLLADESAALAPASWSEEVSSTLPTSQWVNSLQAPLLPELVDEALNANTDVQSAIARLDVARASAIQAHAGLFPTVSGSVRGNRSEFGDSLRPDTTSYSVGPAVSWEADVWGRLRDRSKSGKLELDAARADYAAVRLSIAGSTAESWFNLIEARLLTELANRDVQTQSKALALTERRFNGGLAPSSDVRLARSSLANSRANLATRKQILASTTRRLEILLRRYPAGELESATELPPLPALSGAGQPIDVFSKRPDLLAAEFRLRSLGLQENIARKNLLPQLTLNADATFSSNKFDTLLNSDALISSIVAGITGPIFNAGSLRAEVKKNQALLRQQLEAYVSTALTAYFEVESALNAEQLLLERENALQESLEEAKKAEQRLQRRYAEGLASILQLLDSQSRAIAAENQLISARRERLNNRVRLHVALGGGQIGNVNYDD